MDSCITLPFNHSGQSSSFSFHKQRDRCCLSALTGAMTHFCPAESSMKCPKYHSNGPLLFPACDQPLISFLIKKAKRSPESDFCSPSASGDGGFEAQTPLRAGSRDPDINISNPLTWERSHESRCALRADLTTCLLYSQLTLPSNLVWPAGTFLSILWCKAGLNQVHI